MAHDRTFRIVVASHGQLAGAMLGSAAMICGPGEDVIAVGLTPDQTPEAFGDVLRSAMGTDGRPVLVMTDMVGGTPHNVAAVVCRAAASPSREVACVSGLNLAMLLEALVSTQSLDRAAIGRLVTAGRDSIVDVMAAFDRSAHG